ncbi:MAG: hypothetical protein P8Q97_16665 [Myxococcota bacterium]|nr:hypothetical protein [Myxococcota bacterium]
MKLRPFLILIEFGLITLPLVWWWTHGGFEAYHAIFKRLAFPLLQELGVTHLNQGLVRDRFVGFIPFLGLMLVTPKIPFGQRIRGVGIGFVVIFFSHVALSYWSWISFGREGESAGSMAQYFPALVLTDAIPFILWALFANRLLLEQLGRVLDAPGRGNASQKTSGENGGAVTGAGEDEAGT